MKKEELKKIFKYIIIAVLIVTFSVRTVFVAANCVLVKIRYDNLFTEKAKNTENVEYFKELEDWLNERTNNIKEDMGDDYPALGTLIEQVSMYNSSYQIQEYIICLVLGSIIGIAVYMMKKDYKKTLHYIAIYILFFTILILFRIINYGLLAVGVPLVSSSISVIDLFEILGTTIIPYTVIYIAFCGIIYLINKKRAQKLNEYIK